MKNHVDLIGRAGKDPEIKTVGENGTKVAEFSLATNNYWKDANGERQEKTQWHSLIAWRGIADICEKYVKKGSLISVTGSIEYDSYENREGHRVNITKINVSEILLLENSSGRS